MDTHPRGREHAEWTNQDAKKCTGADFFFHQSIGLRQIYEDKLLVGRALASRTNRFISAKICICASNTSRSEYSGLRGTSKLIRSIVITDLAQLVKPGVDIQGYRGLSLTNS
jgi:hypothetical protein